jgi:hypothetical protein
MSSEEVNQQSPADPGSGPSADGASAKSVSSKKIEANRRNAQQSTGPKTAEGKANSAKNAVKHGIFVKQILQGADDEEAAEIEGPRSRDSRLLSADRQGRGDAGRKDRRGERALRSHLGL